MISPRADCVLSGLNSEQLQRLVHVGESIELDKNKIIIAEGHKDRCFYYIIEGSVEIYKNSGTRNHVLTTLSAGETVGELALVDDHARSAYVKTLEPVKMFRFDIERLYQDPEYADILSSIDSKIGKQLSQRLRLINEVTVAVLRRKFAMSIFSIRALVLLSLYALSLSFIEKSKHLLPSTTPLSLVLIFIFSLVTYSVIRQSGYPREDYGLSIKNAPQHIFEAVLYSLPIMVLIVLIKWLAITHISSLSHYPLFDPAAMFKQGALFHWNIYFIAMFFYALFCPLQEFIVRGCMQSSFQNLIEGTATRKKWEAIFVSNLLFSSAHAHTSTGFAIITFVPGMFWGWLYYRQQTLVGVSVSHILIGVWAAFIIGFQNMI